MVTPEYLNEIMYNVNDALTSTNEKLIKIIAERVLASFTNAEGNLFIPSTLSDLRKIINSGVLIEDLQKALIDELPQLEKEIRQAFLESAQEITAQNLGVATKIAQLEGLSAVVPEYEQVGIVREAEQLQMTKAEIRKMEEVYRRTRGSVRNMTRTVPLLGNEQYIKTCDSAFMKAQSGMSVQTAIIDSVKEMAEQGVSCVEYASGKVDNIEVAIARAVRTGVNNANGSIVLQRCAEMGVPYVKTSSHMGARVTKAEDFTNHSWWQGRVYSIDWNSAIMAEYTKNLSDDERFAWLGIMREELQSKKQANYPDFVETCGYGDIQGICGINCRHSFYPFYPGIQLDDDDRPNIADNEKRYKLDQKQRAMERDIRATKRQMEALKAIKDDSDEWKEAMKNVRKTLHAQSDKYMAFCNDNGLKPRNMSLKI